MAGKAVTRAELIALISARTKLQRAEAGALLEQMLAMMETALTEGEAVKLARFGNFVTRAKSERVGRNPKTGREVPITPRRVVTFRPSQILRERVEKGGARKAKRAG
jgi:integration host factor subunit alpha